MANEITRTELAAMSPAAAMAIVLEGKRKIVDDPPRPPAVLPAGAVSRRAFDAMSQTERLAIVKAGTLIADGDAPAIPTGVPTVVKP